MSYLTETATLEFDPSGGGSNNNAVASAYDYHLPHTKTIDLIGEEFVQKTSRSGSMVENSSPHNLGPNVVLVNNAGIGGGGVPLQVQQILQQAQHQVLLSLMITYAFVVYLRTDSILAGVDGKSDQQQYCFGGPQSSHEQQSRIILQFQY